MSSAPSPVPSSIAAGTPASPLPHPAGPGARVLLLPQAGRGALFFQLMFGIVLVISLRAIVFKREWLAPSLLLLIGVAGLVAVHRVGKLAVRAMALHEHGLVAVARAGDTFWPWAELLEVRRDEGPDDRAAFLVRVAGDRVLRVRTPPGAPESVLQTFVEQLAAHAGFTWRGPRAHR